MAADPAGKGAELPRALALNPGYFIVFRVNRTDEERTAFLRALVYCLHLPRTVWDVQRTQPIVLVDAVGKGEQSHRIGMIRHPEQFARTEHPRWRELAPMLLLAPDDLVADAEALALLLGTPLGAVAFSRLDQPMLKRHWAAIVALDPQGPHLEGPIPTLDAPTRLLPLKLAAQFLARQTGLPLEKIGGSPEDVEGLATQVLELHTMLRMMARVQRDKRPKPRDRAEFNALHVEEVRKLRLPAVVVARSSEQRDTLWQGAGIKSIGRGHDEGMLHALLAHRTLACQGLGVGFSPGTCRATRGHSPAPVVCSSLLPTDQPACGAG